MATPKLTVPEPKTPPIWKDRRPPYLMLGSGLSSAEHNSSDIIDALAVIGSLNKSQLKIFLYFKDMITIGYSIYNKNSVAHLRNLNQFCFSDIALESHKEIKALMQKNNNIKTLVDLKLVKRSKRKCYMVNPYVLIPSQNFKLHTVIWQYYESHDPSDPLSLSTLLSLHEAFTGEAFDIIKTKKLK